MKSLNIFNVALNAERPVLAEQRDAGLITSQDDTFKAVWSEATEIKNLALIPGKSYCNPPALFVTQFIRWRTPENQGELRVCLRGSFCVPRWVWEER